MEDVFKLYRNLHLKRKNTRVGLFEGVKEKYSVEKALYPNSFVHVTPSLVFSKAVYTDDKKYTDEFFSSRTLFDYLDEYKKYQESPRFRFHFCNYVQGIPEPELSFDLLISQYSGFVSRDCKKYLRTGGVLIADDTHGDASLAYLDPDYEFIAVYNRRSDRRYEIQDEELDDFFIPESKKVVLTEKYILGLGYGIRYWQKADGYIFKKIA